MTRLKEVIMSQTLALTPMMTQYHHIKDDYKDYILFFRLGDFYEMFFEDAVVASKVLEITLTKRNAGGGESAPLCGVPYHAAEAYIAKLVSHGFKVAICEQMEDPALAKGIVKREVVRLVTPGTVIDPSMLDDKTNNFILSIYEQNNRFSISYADVTTGLLRTTEFEESQLHMLYDELLRLSPAEIIMCEDLTNTASIRELATRIDSTLTLKTKGYFSLSHATVLIKRIYGIQNLDGIGLYQKVGSVQSTGALLAYLEETQKNTLNHFNLLEVYQLGDQMIIDHFTRLNLELTQTMRQKDKKGSLLWVLDHTKTAMGGRLLKRWIEEPLLTIEGINRRLDCVKFFFEEVIVRTDIRHYLSQIYDLERLLTKAIFGSLNARDAVALKQSLSVLPGIQFSLTSQDEEQAIAMLLESFDTLSDVYDLLDTAIVDDPPFSIREGGIFKDGYHQELDELRNITKHGKEWLLSIEEKERTRTGIKNLKIGFNKVFGYFIEISKGSIKNAPQDYIRKQTLANCERYIMPELKIVEDKILGAEERLNKLEYELFLELKNTLIKSTDRLKHMSMIIAQLDVLTNFAQVSEHNSYTPPEVFQGDTIEIYDGRHPVVERIVSEEGFIPNDTLIDCNEHQIYIITGPNMAGKSTYLRQVALIVLMSQIGCFVPAKSAKIGIVDRIFTRVGASDDLFSGQSTFMVEMNELANILNYASEKSLIILDEIGRGTSTYDGLSIAWSTIEYLSHTIGAKTIFATHYHELTELEGKVKGVKNFCIAVREEGDHIVFLRKIIRGGANQSFGIQVAKLAGVPHAVISRAKTLLLELEESDITRQRALPIPREDNDMTPLKPTTSSYQLSMEDYLHKELLSELKSLDVSNMTPLHAITKLNELVERSKKQQVEL